MSKAGRFVSGKTAFTFKPFASTKRAAIYDNGFDKVEAVNEYRSGGGISGNPSILSRLPTTGQQVGKISVGAAREGVTSTAFWKLLTDRAMNLPLEPQDVAFLLNGMSRVRVPMSSELIAYLTPIVEAKLAYFSSVHLSMTLAAVSKSESKPSVEELVGILVAEVGNRVHEFSTPLEFTMILNALSRLRRTDKVLLHRLATVIQTRLSRNPLFFQTKDLVTIASTFSALHACEPALFEKLKEFDFRDVNPIEAGKLVCVFKSDDHSLVALTLPKIKYLTPTDLVSAMHAWSAISPAINNEILRVFLSSISLFQAQHVAEILSCFSRWKVPMNSQQIGLLDAALCRLLACEDANLVSIVGSLHALKTEKNGQVSVRYFSLVAPKLFAAIGSNPAIDVFAIVRAITAYSGTELLIEFKSDLVRFVLQKRFSGVKHSLRPILEKTFPPEDDLLLALA